MGRLGLRYASHSVRVPERRGCAIGPTSWQIRLLGVELVVEALLCKQL